MATTPEEMQDTPRERLRSTIKWLMDRNGVTQAEMAALLPGLNSQSAVSARLKGADFKESELEIIAAHFGLEPADLYAGVSINRSLHALTLPDGQMELPYPADVAQTLAAVS